MSGSAPQTADKFVPILTCPAPVCRIAQVCLPLYSFTRFLREEGKDEKEETAPGQSADHHVQVYLSPSCILWTSLSPQPCLSDSESLLSFFHGCQNGDVFHGREKRKDRNKRKGKEARCNLPRISPTPARELQSPPLYIQSE